MQSDRRKRAADACSCIACRANGRRSGCRPPGLRSPGSRARPHVRKGKVRAGRRPGPRFAPAACQVDRQGRHARSMRPGRFSARAEKRRGREGPPASTHRDYWALPQPLSDCGQSSTGRRRPAARRVAGSAFPRRRGRAPEFGSRAGPLARARTPDRAKAAPRLHVVARPSRSVPPRAPLTRYTLC